MRKSKKGFTLIEAIIAIAILTVIAAILGNLIFTAINIRNVNRERQEALNVTTSIMDEITAYQSEWGNYDGLKSWLAAHGFEQTGENSYRTTKLDSHSIQYETSIELSRPDGLHGLLQISLNTNSPHVNALTIVTYIRG